MSAKGQRAALITAIRRIFPDAQVERSDLSWLTVPEIGQLDGQLGPIFDALKCHRGHKDFATSGRRLACDIVIPSQQIIVEYDERQHFTVPRSIALQHYPRNIAVGFDVAQWIAHCEAIAAVDNDPPYRDEQRAFYDSVRDLLAGKNGYRVVRLKHGAFDWESASADQEISKRLSVHSDAVNQSTPRFATVCIKGQPALQYCTHSRRLALLTAIAHEINERWGNLDAVAFPGGFLRLNRTIGSLPYAERVKALSTAGFVDPIKSAIGGLTRSPSSLLVFGVDSPRYPNGDLGDQLCVAADKTGIIGIGRKVFPTKTESRGLLCCDADFREAHRVIQLPSGRKAVLFACYDMFGVVEHGDLGGTRARNIRCIGDYEDKIERGTERFQEQLTKNLASFRELLTSQGVTVGIAAIHCFDKHNTAFWQRHGIAACSAALREGFAIGAAHFRELPRSAISSTLAAARVPRQRLADNRHRQAHSWTPHEHFNLQFDRSSALVRLFC